MRFAGEISAAAAAAVNLELFIHRFFVFHLPLQPLWMTRTR
jgi:hypothetical protein